MSSYAKPGRWPTKPSRTGALLPARLSLCLSLNTIKAYNKALYRKLGVSSRPDAVVVARQLGLI